MLLPGGAWLTAHGGGHLDLQLPDLDPETSYIRQKQPLSTSPDVAKVIRSARAPTYTRQRPALSPCGTDSDEILAAHCGVPNGALRPFPRPIVEKILNYRDRDQLLRAAREQTQVSQFPDYTLGVQRQHSSFMEVKNLHRTAGPTYALIIPAKLKVIHEQHYHFINPPPRRKHEHGWITTYWILKSRADGGGRIRSPATGPTTNIAEELQRLTHSLHHPLDRPRKSKRRPAFSGSTADCDALP
ncbi:hypothetical protein NDU88_004459 [Pleurodeles waltl]|uniref:Uncharacterized protein n=1 Tax=Pleurodeles waltl TaxID=8319 RepID=A0AAV7MUZ0_PLEWA|nr:hypothetical protein NDU88_004459 [Pleurodeles waltl]